MTQSDIQQLESWLFRLHEIEFSASPKAESKLKIPFETMKHRFFEITKAAFWDRQEAENESKVT